MNKIDLLIKNLNVSEEKNVNFNLFSEEAYTKCKIGSTDDFYDEPEPEDIANYIFEEVKNKNIKTVSFNVIDNEYFNFIKENKLKDNEKSRNKYVSLKNENEKIKLWKETKYNESYDWGIIPIIMENSSYVDSFKLKDVEKVETNYFLSDNTIENIKKIIFNSFKEIKKDNTSLRYDFDIDNLYVSPYILDIEDFNNEQVIDELFSNGIGKLNKEKVTIDKNKQKQFTNKGIPINFYGIFIMYRYEVPMVISKNYIEEIKESTINKPTLDIQLIEDEIKHDVDTEFQILTLNIIYPEFISPVIEDFENYCLEKIKTKTEEVKNINDSLSKHLKNRDKKKK